MIVDIHTHVFPDHVAERAIPFLEKEGNITAFLDGTVSSLLASMGSAGVDVSVVASIATKPSQFESIFAWSADIASTRIIPFPSVHPADADAPAKIARIAASGFRGLKMHPYYQEFSLTEDRMLPIYEAAQDAELILLMHSGFDLAFPRDRIADPAKTREVLARFPRLQLIASHLGAWEDWDAVEEHLLGREIYLDTSYSIPFLGKERTRRLLTQHPADYILFGTDSPWGGQAEELAAIRQLDLPGDVETKILGRNAAYLLGISRDTEPCSAGAR